jgi:LysM repeat protein
MLNIKLEKATPGRPPRRRKSLLQQLQGRVYRLPAHLTNEDDWQRDVPNVKLSRAFAVVLGIHVVAIGGFMAFELFRHKDAETDSGANSATARPAASTTAGESLPATVRTPASSAPRGAEPALNDPANDGLRTYVVGPGETLGAIAARFDVDERLLAQKNGIGRERPFETGMKLVIPNQQITARRPGDLDQLLERNEKDGAASENPVPVARAEPAGNPGSDKVAARAGAIEEPASTAAAPVEDKPVRRAEPLTESTRMKPNKDPKRASAPPAKVAASQASRLSTATASTPVKRAGTTGADGSTAASKPAARGRRTHIVVEGDTAFRIARTYKVDVDDLIKVNSVKPEKLRPGMRLVIPASSN